MKKIVFSLCIAAMSAAMFTSCSKDNKDERKDVPNVPKEMTIAYIESDSVMNQYKFAKDITEQMDAKQTNITTTLSQKENALNAAYSTLQSDYQAGKIASQQEFQNRQASIQQQGADYQTLSQRLSGEFQEEQAKYQQAINDSIQNFIKEFNKDQKYSYIFIKGGLADNLLYANPACDITKQVIEGLNKRYTGMKKDAAKPQEEKK